MHSMRQVMRPLPLIASNQPIENFELFRFPSNSFTPLLGMHSLRSTLLAVKDEQFKTESACQSGQGVECEARLVTLITVFRSNFHPQMPVY